MKKDTDATDFRKFLDRIAGRVVSLGAPRKPCDGDISKPIVIGGGSAN